MVLMLNLTQFMKCISEYQCFIYNIQNLVQIHRAGK